MTAVWGESQHSGNALLLLLAIADFADDNGVAWPGHERLSQKTRVSRRHVIRLVDEAAKSGELWAMNRKHQQSNVYIVTPGLTLENLQEGTRRAMELGVQSTRGSDKLSLPPQVLVVVTGCPYLEAEKHAGRDIMSLGGDIYVTTLGTQVSPDPSLSVINHEGDNIWKTILSDLQMLTDKQTYNQWLKHSQVVATDNGTWTVQMPSADAIAWIEGRFRKRIEQAVERHAEGVELEFVA